MASRRTSTIKQGTGGYTPYHFFYVYLLESVRHVGELYIGSTRDLRKRLNQHNTGKAFSTKRYIPWRLQYYEAYQNESSARLRESRLKNNGNALIELKKRIGVGFMKKSGKGYTLLEILIVMGLIALLGGVGMLMSMETFKTSIFHNDRDLLVSAMRKARSESINNMCFGPAGFCTDGKAHGVHIAPGTYTIFQGDSYAGRDVDADENIDAKPGTTFTGPADIIFEKLSGETTPVSIMITDDNGKNSTITLNAEGRIIWSTI